MVFKRVYGLGPSRGGTSLYKPLSISPLPTQYRPRDKNSTKTYKLLRSVLSVYLMLIIKVIFSEFRCLDSSLDGAIKIHVFILLTLVVNSLSYIAIPN